MDGEHEILGAELAPPEESELFLCGSLGTRALGGDARFSSLHLFLTEKDGFVASGVNSGAFVHFFI